MSDDRSSVAPPAGHDPERQPHEAPVAAIDVYWRPRCFYCFRLRRALRRAGVTGQEHNIWEDRRAREFVRRHANGNETVPTVVVGEHVYVNPRPRTLLAELRGRATGERPPDVA